MGIAFGARFSTLIHTVVTECFWLFIYAAVALPRILAFSFHTKYECDLHISKRCGSIAYVHETMHGSLKSQAQVGPDYLIDFLLFISPLDALKKIQSMTKKNILE